MSEEQVENLIEAYESLQCKYKKEKQELISEFVELLKRNEIEIIKDMDTIGFIIKGLEEEGYQYILNDKKEWEGEE